MEINMRRPKVTGDSYRDYRKYLEIQKMNKPSTNIVTNLNSNMNANNLLYNTLQRQTNTPSINSPNIQTNRLSRPQSTSNITTNLANAINNNLYLQSNQQHY